MPDTTASEIHDMVSGWPVDKVNPRVELACECSR